MTCPTPDKNRYATRKAAETRGHAADLRIGTTLHPYRCTCGWWHLTKNPHARREYTTAPRHEVERLQHLTADQFATLVSLEVKNKATNADRLAIRHPDLHSRWRWALKALRADLTRQLRTRTGTQDWQHRTRQFRDAVTFRIAECQALRHEATRRPQAA